jgi:hypothetical protein
MSFTAGWQLVYNRSFPPYMSLYCSRLLYLLVILLVFFFFFFAFVFVYGVWSLVFGVLISDFGVFGIGGFGVRIFRFVFYLVVR